MSLSLKFTVLLPLATLSLQFFSKHQVQDEPPVHTASLPGLQEMNVKGKSKFPPTEFSLVQEGWPGLGSASPAATEEVEPQGSAQPGYAGT